MNHDELREWVQLEADGALETSRHAALAAHLAVCPECAAERESLARLDRTLRASRISVRPDFRSAVLSALPPAGWEARTPRAWAWPVALFVALTVGAAALLWNAGGSSAHGPVLGALAALGDLLATTVTTGAGLLSASWRGVGLAVRDLFGGSVLRMGVFGLGVACLNLLFFRLLRRPRSAEAEFRRR